jgi:TM2 domain-containing membrane protein YozV
MKPDQSNDGELYSEPSAGHEDQPSSDSYQEHTSFAEAQTPQDGPSVQEPIPPPTLVCPHCQQEHPVGTQYCPVTGKPLAPASSTAGSSSAQGFTPQSQPSYPPSQVQYPGAYQQPYYPQPYPGYAQPRSTKDRNIALVLEILPGLFGILGIGWIYSGKTGTGIAWLIGYLIWTGIVITAAVLTGFMACFCTVPINLICVGISAYSLNSFTKENPHLFGS